MSTTYNKMKNEDGEHNTGGNKIEPPKKSQILLPPPVLPRIITSIDNVIRNLGDGKNPKCMDSRQQQQGPPHHRKRKLGELLSSPPKQPPPPPNTNDDDDNDEDEFAAFQRQLQRDDDEPTTPTPTPTTTTNNKPTNNNLLSNSPPGLEVQYIKLCNLLRTGLLGIEGNHNNDNTSSSSCDGGTGTKRNVSALLMGPRGHGKSLVLERCIATLQRELTDIKGRRTADTATGDTGPSSTTRLCRIVRLNGTLLRGNDVALAVKEIVRQLSEIAAEESFQNLQNVQQQQQQQQQQPTTIEPTSIDGDNNNNNNNDSTIRKESQIQTLLQESYALRIRKTTFNSSLALLDEVLMTALVDSIPILVVLEELDTFLAYSSSSSSTNNTNNGGYSGQPNNSSNKPGGGGVTIAAPPTERHLLLYHLLDRVAGHGSLVSLVGMTSRLSTVSLFEKRVKSRAEGTSKIIYFGHASTFEVLVEVLLSKFTLEEEVEEEEEEECGSTTTSSSSLSTGYDGNAFINDLKSQLQRILLPPDEYRDPMKEKYGGLDEEVEDPMKQDQASLQAFEVRRMMERSYDSGKDTRWFCRIVSMALSLFAEDLQSYYSVEQPPPLGSSRQWNSKKVVDQTMRTTTADEECKVPAIVFDPKYLYEGLVVMGGTKDMEESCPGGAGGGAGGGHGVKSHIFDNKRCFESMSSSSYLASSSATTQKSTTSSLLKTNSIYGPFDCNGQRIPSIGWNSARLQALLDLPGSQVAILLAAKRVLTRDAQKQDSNISTIPLTYDRIEMEYESYKASGLDRYGGHILYRSFCQLMETDLIRPARDHAGGGGALQYYYRGHHNPVGSDPMALRRLPLHVNVDLREELGVALKNKMLDCTTALRDWGLKEN